MNNHYYLTFDVGGLFIRGGALNKKGVLLSDSHTYYPAKSKSQSEEILTNLVNIICRQINSIIDKGFVIDGIGFAFPGPFDYENGICMIKGVEKFDSLYGINLREELLARLIKEKVFVNNVSSQFKILFENNVSMFALGEWHRGKSSKYHKIFFLTLGNGTGSAFLENGTIIKNRYDVPPNGWVYNIPFRDSIVDDYISTRGIYNIFKELGLSTDYDLEQLANLATSNHKEMKQVFQKFGEYLGEMLYEFVTPFKPDALIIGGQISKSYKLFEKEVLKHLKNENVDIFLSDETSNSTFVGLSSLFDIEIPKNIKKD